MRKSAPLGETKFRLIFTYLTQKCDRPGADKEILSTPPQIKKIF